MYFTIGLWPSASFQIFVLHPWSSSISPIPYSCKQPALNKFTGVLSFAMTTMFLRWGSGHGFYRPVQSWKQLASSVKTVRHFEWEPACTCPMVMDMCLLLHETQRCSILGTRCGKVCWLQQQYALSWSQGKYYSSCARPFPNETLDQLQKFMLGTYQEEREASTATEERVWSPIMNTRDECFKRKER